MQFVTIAIFAVTTRLVALAIANPVPNWKASGVAIPLARHPTVLDSNKTIDLDAITYHGISVREKILRGLDNYEMNTGMKHPFAVKQSNSEPGLGRRGASIPLTAYRNRLWMAEISIGTPPKNLKVTIDTGAADMWLLQTGCDGISVDRDLWDPHSSTSAKKQSKSFQVTYSDGSNVQGDRYTDNVKIGGLTANSQTFGSATSYTSFRSFEYPADGLLGLAFPTVSEFGSETLFTSLVQQNMIINPTFSFKLSSSGAEMYIGGANSMLYNGDITHTPVTHPAFWQVSMDDLRVNDHSIFENVPVTFDTGADLIFGDWEQVAELYRGLGGTLMRYRGLGLYDLPCDSFPTVSFTFGGKSFEIPPEALRLKPITDGSPYCFSAIVAHRLTGLWSIGLPFLQGVYSVFDYSTLQVGFADLA